MSAKPLQLLLVEDSQSDAAQIRQFLSKGMGASCEVVWVKRAAEAVQKLEAQVFSVVILDLGLPDSLGMDTLRLIRKAAPSAAIVVLTIEGDVDLAEQTIQEGAQDYLVKGSFNGDLLARVIRYSLERLKLLKALLERADWLDKTSRGAMEIVDRNMDGQVVVNHAGKILYANPAAKIIFDKSLEELAETPFAYSLAAGEMTEIEILRGEQFPIIAEMYVADIEWEGKPAHLASLRDITARKNLESQLQQAQKMEAVGQLAGGVAHDFNNILTVIIGHTQLMKMKVESTDPLYEELELLHKSGHSAAELTRQLLAFSRQQILKPVVVDLNSIVTSMEKMLRRLVRADIEIHSQLAPDLKAVRVDPSQMEQVVMNLVINARDAMPDGGKLSIETTNVHLDEAYARIHPYVKAGDFVMLAVSDTGSGMSKEVRARIFEPFYTTKALGKGTGLGLATVYGIVKQSNGQIEVYSEEGKGTTFKVYMPVEAGSVSNEKVTKAPDLSEEVKATILVAEDNQEVAKLLRRILTGFGFTVLLGMNGAEALKMASEHDGVIDLLITDVIMPEMNGPDLAARILQSRKDIKILYTSGYTDLAAVRNDIIDDRAAFLPKPFTPESVLGKIREVLAT